MESQDVGLAVPNDNESAYFRLKLVQDLDEWRFRAKVAEFELTEQKKLVDVLQNKLSELVNK